jgi:hypothetical protein
VSPLSQYDKPELKSELICWIKRQARARVIGPSDVGKVDTSVGVDVSLVAMSSSPASSSVSAVVGAGDYEGIGAASFVGAVSCASNVAASVGFSDSGAKQVTFPLVLMQKFGDRFLAWPHMRT